MDLGVGDPGVVIDDGVNERGSDLGLTVSRSRRESHHRDRGPPPGSARFQARGVRVERVLSDNGSA